MSASRRIASQTWTALAVRSATTGECIEIEPECATSRDCAGGQICDDGECVEIEPECEANFDCEGGEICRDGPLRCDRGAR